MHPASIEQHLQDAVTLHMRLDFPRLFKHQNVAEALESVRRHPPSGRIIYFYVVDADGRLEGVVPTRRLLLAPLDQPVADIMVKQVIAVPESATVLEACEFFTLHRFLAFPVVGHDRRLLGVVDVEMYTQELSDLETSTRTDDLFQLMGMHLMEARKPSPIAAFWGRFPWLLTNIGAGFLAALLAGFYEAELQAFIALALFIPVVLALAESVGIQSVSLALQALHSQRPTLREVLKRLRRELATGLLLGTASGLAVGILAGLWLRQPGVALVILGGIAGGVTVAAVVGVAMPNLLRLLRRDPQVAAGPIALACADMATLLIYFTLARWVLM